MPKNYVSTGYRIFLLIDSFFYQNLASCPLATFEYATSKSALIDRLAYVYISLNLFLGPDIVFSHGLIDPMNHFAIIFQALRFSLTYLGSCWSYCLGYLRWKKIVSYWASRMIFCLVLWPKCFPIFIYKNLCFFLHSRAALSASYFSLLVLCY